MSFKKWTVARRGSQVAVLLLIASPLAGLAFFNGNLAAADLIGIPLADPLAAVQVALASRVIVPGFVASALAVAMFYLLLGGRTFCAWICPVYLLTELADGIRRRLGTGGRTAPLELKRWLLLLVIVATTLSGLPIFEILSPIGMVGRAVAFGGYAAIVCLLGLVLIEVVFARRLWCRSLCPLGGFYSLLGAYSPTRIGFYPSRCTACGECLQACPVEEVLEAPLNRGETSVRSGDCTRCGACMDACSPRALRLDVSVKQQRDR
jgi:ferredoxin-type protein NapH